MASQTTPAPRKTVVGLRPDKWYQNLAFHRVPPNYLLGAFLCSYLILAISFLETDIGWLAFGLALIPWGIILFFEVEWTYRHFKWLTLGFLMAVVQFIHYAEHCIEVIQYHIFNDPIEESLAIFTTLNVEYVHFLGDSFLTLGTLVLLTVFRHNPWFYIAIPAQLAHQFEHNFLWFTHQFLGAPAGAPGVLGKSGLAGPDGLLGFPRVDLHWWYNTFYTIPFVIGLIWQAKRTYDEHLREAFPDVPEEELIKASKHLATFQYAPGETITAPGDDVERLYIVTEGQVAVTEPDEQGNEVEVARLHPGQYFGEVALLVPEAKHTKTVRALTNARVLAMDEETFRHLQQVSTTHIADIEATARARMGTHHETPPPSPASGS